MKSKIFVLFSFVCFSFALFGQGLTEPVTLRIKWGKDLTGDFSFTENWSYPIGVELKPDGKAGCADGGFCPERCYGMLDENGIVLPDSATVFYQLLDTTHQFQTIQSETNCYEWDGTDFIEVFRTGKHSVYGFTATGIATHCSLQIVINKNDCRATIHLNSITPDGDADFYCNGGEIIIDKESWKKGILKAEFTFMFEGKDAREEPLYWRGKIFSSINPFTRNS